MAGAIHTDAPCGHRLQQGTLGAGAGAVDLIGQQHLGEQRPGLKSKLSRGAIQHIDPGQISRQKIAGETDALESQVPTAGQSFRQGGFSQSRSVFDQQMPPGQKAAERQAHLLLLAEQHRTDRLRDLIQRRIHRTPPVATSSLAPPGHMGFLGSRQSSSRL